MPVFGNVSVAAIDVDLVLKVLEPIWEAKNETARRVRGRLEVILDWATAGGLRRGENPARWKGLLEHRLSKQPRSARINIIQPSTGKSQLHDPLAPGGRRCCQMSQFTILTGARTSEAIGATWKEFDLDALLWTVPADRIKAGRAHRVPLADRAVAIVREQARFRQGDYVFSGRKPGTPLSNMAMAACYAASAWRMLPSTASAALFATGPPNIPIIRGRLQRWRWRMR
jgi:integrase